MRFMTKKIMTPSISFIILNYNGKYLTENCINSLKNAIEYSNINEYEIIVVDNGSSDGSVEYLKEKFFDLKFIDIGENKFITSYNIGVINSKFEWVFLLNNDMLFEKNFLIPIIEDINNINEKIFAIGTKLIKFDGTFEKGSNIPIYKYGLIWLKSVDSNILSKTFYIGTHGIFRKEIFLKLRGFDEIYKPFYFEDVDLCYRAQKYGYEIYYEPRSIIYHKHMGTIRNFFEKKYILKVFSRNRLIFHIKNLTSKKFILKFYFHLPILLLSSIFVNKSYYISAFIDILKIYKEIIRKKLIEKEKFVINDEEIISKFK